MLEKKNKLSQPTTVLIKISDRLSDAVYRYVNKKCAVFLYNTHF